MWWYSFLYYETMRLGDVRLRDDRLRVFRSEVCETGKITITIRCLDVFKSFSLLISQSHSLPVS